MSPSTHFSDIDLSTYPTAAINELFNYQVALSNNLRTLLRGNLRTLSHRGFPVVSSSIDSGGVVRGTCRFLPHLELYYHGCEYIPTENHHDAIFKTANF
jgi:hypothetical protein